jgi:Ca2+-binding EF-hand superfamily protein
MEVLQSLRAKAKAADDAARREAELEAQAEEMLIAGMTQEQLEGVFRDVFRQADRNGNGTLSRKEFRAALHSADLGLKRTDINLLMSVADEDESGDVSYEEFVPICFGVLLEKLKREILSNSELNRLDELSERLLSELAPFAETEDLRLSKKALKRAFKGLAREWIGLTRIQLASILSLPEASKDEEGLVSLHTFVPAAASAIHGMVVVDKARQTAAAAAKIAQTTGAHILARFDEESVRQVLLEAFIRHDADGSGALDPDEAEQLLRTVGVEQLGLREREVEALLAAMDEVRRRGLDDTLLT